MPKNYDGGPRTDTGVMVGGAGPREFSGISGKARHRRRLTACWIIELKREEGAQGLGAEIVCKLASTCANSVCNGKALLKEATTRRTLTVTRAPSLSKRQRMVETWAR